jgi:hypothetical protein
MATTKSSGGAAANAAETKQPIRRTSPKKAQGLGSKRRPTRGQKADNVTLTEAHEGRRTRDSTVPVDTPFRPGSKAEEIVALLKNDQGAAIAELVEATGWQPHSVRGFLSGALKSKRGLMIVSEKGDNGIRRYRIAS